MNNLTKKYFEQVEVWDNDHRKNEVENRRIMESISAIPPGVRTILDAGCGSGTFLRNLKTNYPNKFNRMAGLDVSVEALRHVKTEAHHGTLTNMPFTDREFELVTCLEVLEHLNINEFHKALSEIERVSAKYIMITVPNCENLIQTLVICPNCCCCFNPWHHVRSFDKSLLTNLFKDFRLESCKGIGLEEEKVKFDPILKGMYLFRLRPHLPNYCICPQCGYNQRPTPPHSDFRGNKKKELLLKFAKFLCSPLKGYSTENKWLLGLYARK